jgi:hypothetical protein
MMNGRESKGRKAEKPKEKKNKKDNFGEAMERAGDVQAHGR